MDDTHERLRLGSLGWQWPAWEEAFYPEGMPPEWRLAYYNTQFNCVFLTEAQWRAAMDEWPAWAEDVQAGFLFLLEGVAHQDVPEVLRGKAVCLPAEDTRLVWFDAASDLRALADGLRQAASTPRYLISRDGDLGQIERVRTLLDLLGWSA